MSFNGDQCQSKGSIANDRTEQCIDGEAEWRRRAQAESRCPLATRSRLPAQQLRAQPRRRHCEGQPDRAAAGWAVMHSCAEDGMAKEGGFVSIAPNLLGACFA